MKNNYGMQLFKFFQPYRKCIKIAKNGGFCEELLSENDFEAVLVNFFCCYEYIIVPNASEAVQKQRLAQAKDTAGVELCQLTKQLIS